MGKEGQGSKRKEGEISGRKWSTKDRNDKQRWSSWVFGGGATFDSERMACLRVQLREKEYLMKDEDFWMSRRYETQGRTEVGIAGRQRCLMENECLRGG